MKQKLFFHIYIAGLVVALWLFAAPAPAYGQTTTWVGAGLAQMIESARWRLGFFRVNAAFQVNNAGYDSDIYYGYLGEAVPDYTFSASAPVQVLMPMGKKLVVDIFDSPQYVFYLNTEKERAWNNTFRGQVHFALDRFYVQAGGGLANVRQRLSPELNINIRSKQASLNGTILWQASREASLALLYGGARYDLGGAEFGGTNLSQTLNRKESYLDFITYLQPNPRVRLFVDGQYGTYTFTEAASSFKNTRSYGLFGGIEFIPREDEARPVAGIQGSITLGYKRFDLIDPLQKDATGFAGEANVSLGLMRLTTGRAFFSRDFQFSAFSGASYYLSTSYGAGVTRLLSKRASLSYDLSFGRSSYPETEAAGESVPTGIYNRYTTHMFNLNVMLARNLGITFLGTLAERVLDATGQKRNRNFFGFNLVYGAATGGISAPVSGLSR